MKAIELIDKLEALPHDAKVWFYVAGYAEAEHLDINSCAKDEDGDVVLEGE